jgi:hypothetical protein
MNFLIKDYNTMWKIFDMLFKKIIRTWSLCFLLLWITFSVCEQPPLTFTPQQQIDLQNNEWVPSQLLGHFRDAEYLLVGFSSPSCKHCVEKSVWMNTNTQFQNKVSWEWSCEFVSLIHDNNDPENALTRRLELSDVGPSTSFVWFRSRKVVDNENTRYTTPTVYGWLEITWTPTFMILNRQWQMVAMKQWDLPLLFDTLCVPNSCNWQWNPPNTWTIDQPWWWSCPGGWWWTNGWWTNGWWTNGWWTNGWWTNGWWTNGWWTNGWWTNDDEQMDDEQTDDEQMDDEQTDDEQTDDEQTDDEQMDDEQTDDEQMDDEQMDDEQMDDEQTDDEQNVSFQNLIIDLVDEVHLIV